MFFVCFFSSAAISFFMYFRQVLSCKDSNNNGELEVDL